MNFVRIIPRVLILVMMFVGNVNGLYRNAGFRRNADKIFVSLGSVLIDEKRTNVLLGDSIAPRDQVIIGKAITGGIGHWIKHENPGEAVLRKAFTGKGTEGYFVCENASTSYVHVAGYVVVNGSLRLAGNKLFLDEKYVEKKCDDVLPESVAWVVKPIANIAIDFAYDYVTVQLVQGIVDGINQNK